MKKLIFFVLLISFLAVPVNASEFEPPIVPESAEKYFPDTTDSFVDGLFQILVKAVADIKPELIEATSVCVSLIAVIIFGTLLRTINDNIAPVVKLVSVLCIGTMLIKPSNVLLNFGVDAIYELSDYGKLLAPVLTGALAAQGGTSTATVLYTFTTILNAVLTSCISHILVPMIYIYMVFCVAGNAIGESILDKVQEFIKSTITWGLKTLLYVFTGFMTVTGIISGAADASTLKATKLTISSAVPVVGKIISDASDSVLTGAAIIKNAGGIYGLLAVICICIGPFLNVGVHYLLLRLTSSICGIFDKSSSVGVVKGFASVMGIVLAMVGTCGLLVMISIVCYIKGLA